MESRLCTSMMPRLTLYAFFKWFAGAIKLNWRWGACIVKYVSEGEWFPFFSHYIFFFFFEFNKRLWFLEGSKAADRLLIGAFDSSIHTIFTSSITTISGGHNVHTYVNVLNSFHAIHSFKAIIDFLIGMAHFLMTSIECFRNDKNMISSC